jgi:hypothetical protein
LSFIDANEIEVIQGEDHQYTKTGKRKSKLHLNRAGDPTQTVTAQYQMIFERLATCTSSTITDFDKVFDEAFIPSEGEPFRYVGKPFVDGLIIPKFKEIMPTQERMREFLRQYVDVYSLKVSANGEDYYVRISDSASILNGPLCDKLQLAMNALREKLVMHWKQ